MFRVVLLQGVAALLALVVWAYRDLVWLAMIASVIVTLKSYLIALIWR